VNADSLKAITSILNDRRPRPLPTQDFSDPAVVELYDTIAELREFLLCLVKGELSQTLLHKGYLAGSLKSLQANLRHLTWQTQRISQGDFTQRVDFMGEFSAAFNAMTLQLKEAREQLEEANRISELRADTDGLTGLYNHVYLMRTLESEIERSTRYTAPLSIMMLDLDFFKKVNDTFGHQAGDSVLKKVSELIRLSLRNVDTSGRYGGEEFMLILPNTDHGGAMELAERIRRQIESTSFTPADLAITISGGVATLEGQKMAELIQQADTRLYEAKRSGRNRVVG